MLNHPDTSEMKRNRSNTPPFDAMYVFLFYHTCGVGKHTTNERLAKCSIKHTLFDVIAQFLHVNVESVLNRCRNHV